jgi:hypothetical protein
MRAFSSSGFLVSLLIGLGIAAHQYIYAQYALGTAEMFEFSVFYGKAQMELPDYIWGAWLGGAGFGIHGYLYFLLLPLLASLPHGVSYLQDTRSGYHNNVIVRAGRKSYYVAKWFATFLTGGLVVVIPLLANLVAHLTSLPLMGPYAETFSSLMSDDSMLSSVFFESPLIYLTICLTLVFVFGGIYATFSLLVTFFTDYAFVALLMPFLASVLFTMILDLFGVAYLSPQEFLYPSDGEGIIAVVLIELAVFLLTSFVVFVRHGLRGSDF